MNNNYFPGIVEVIPDTASYSDMNTCVSRPSLDGYEYFQIGGLKTKVRSNDPEAIEEVESGKDSNMNTVVSAILWRQISS